MKPLLTFAAFILAVGAALPKEAPSHHTQQGRGYVLHRTCAQSGFYSGQMARIIAGTLAGHDCKVLNLQPNNGGHCHALVAIPDLHNDVLSIIAIVEVDILRRME